MRHQFVRSLAGSRDPNFKNVTLLLHGDGTNGGQNNTFLDSGPNNLTITRNGSVPQGSFSPYGDRWSNYFDGNGDYYLTVPSGAFSYTSGTAYTFECWVYPTSYPVQYPTIFTANVGAGSNTAAMYIENNGSCGFGQANVGTVVVAPAGSIILNRWNHIAIGKNSSNSVRMWVNGVSVATGTDTTNYAVGAIRIGLNGVNANPFAGYISNFRSVTGSDVYGYSNTAIAVPTAPLTAITNTVLLTCQSNRFRDASTNNFTITRTGDVSVQRFSPFSPDAEYRTDRIAGSAYFSGANSNSLSVSSATANIDTNPFTVESWVYYLGTNNQAWFTPAPGIPFTVVGTTLRVYYATGFLSAGPIERNAWTHIAVTRDFSNVLRVFVNGVLNSSVTTTTAFNSTTPIIGERFGNGTPFVGYIAGFRLLIHTPLYTSNFTPPTSPPTVINDTRWLVNFTNASVRDNAMMNNLETVGNAQIDTTTKKFGTGSLEFDGNGDYLSFKVINELALNIDFTVELWFYARASRTHRMFSLHASGTGASYFAGLRVDLNGNGTFGLYSSSGVAHNLITNQGSWSVNTWTHLAITKSGNDFKFFKNGTQFYTAAPGHNLMTGSVHTIGMLAGYGADWFDGLIDDFRVTRGVVRYTSDFTPPTAPFPDF